MYTYIIWALSWWVIFTLLSIMQLLLECGTYSMYKQVPLCTVLHLHCVYILTQCNITSFFLCDLACLWVTNVIHFLQVISHDYYEFCTQNISEPSCSNNYYWHWMFQGLVSHKEHPMARQISSLCQIMCYIAFEFKGWPCNSSSSLQQTLIYVCRNYLHLHTTNIAPYLLWPGKEASSYSGQHYSTFSLLL